MLSPKVEIDRSLDTLPPDTRKAVAGRLHGWLASETEQRLKPLARLVALAGDKAQPPAVRGLAVRLIDGAGIVERREVDDLVAALSVEGRRTLSRAGVRFGRSEEHTSELQSLMRISYAVFCLKKKKQRP